MFDAAGLTGLRELAVGSFGEDQFDEFRMQTVGELLDPDLDESDELSVSNPREGCDDIRNLFAGVEFLRYLEGEKHIIFLTERGLVLPERRQLESGRQSRRR